MKWIGQTIYKFQKAQRNNSFHYDAKDGFLQFEVILILHIVVQPGTVVVLKITIFSLRQADLNRNYKSLRQKISLLCLMEVC